MLKLFRLTFVQRGSRLCGGLLIASGLVLWLMADSPVMAQPPRPPLLKGGVEEQQLPAPPLKKGRVDEEGFERTLLGSFGDRSHSSYEKDCRAFQELVELNRKALKSPKVVKSQAWHDAANKLFDHTSKSEFHGSLMRKCHCPIIDGRSRIEQWWESQRRRRSEPQGQRFWDYDLQMTLGHLERTVWQTEACFKKACAEPVRPIQAADCIAPVDPQILESIRQERNEALRTMAGMGYAADRIVQAMGKLMVAHLHHLTEPNEGILVRTAHSAGKASVYAPEAVVIAGEAVAVYLANNNEANHRFLYGEVQRTVNLAEEELKRKLRDPHVTIAEVADAVLVGKAADSTATVCHRWGAETLAKLKSKIDQARKAKQEFLGKGEGPGKPGTTSGPGPGIRFSKAPPASMRGMTDKDDRFLGDLAAQEGKIILVRDSNREALKWVGKKGYAPKPKILKAKTLKQGEYAGLASVKGLSDEEINEILSFKSGVRNDKGELQSVFIHGSEVEDFVISVRATGTRYYSDTDLHGIYNANGTDAWNDDIARIMNRNLGERMIQHGPQDKWEDRLDKAKVGDNAGPQAGNGKAVTAYLPDGSTQHLTTVQEMKSFYLARGMNWNAIWPGY